MAYAKRTCASGGLTGRIVLRARRAADRRVDVPVERRGALRLHEPRCLRHRRHTGSLVREGGAEFLVLVVGEEPHLQAGGIEGAKRKFWWSGSCTSQGLAPFELEGALQGLSRYYDAPCWAEPPQGSAPRPLQTTAPLEAREWRA